MGEMQHCSTIITLSSGLSIMGKFFPGRSRNHPCMPARFWLKFQHQSLAVSVERKPNLLLKSWVRVFWGDHGKHMCPHCRMPNEFTMWSGCFVRVISGCTRSKTALAPFNLAISYCVVTQCFGGGGSHSFWLLGKISHCFVAVFFSQDGKLVWFPVFVLAAEAKSTRLYYQIVIAGIGADGGVLPHGFTGVKQE